MAKFYTLDRDNLLSEGMVIELGAQEGEGSLSPATLSLFPEGVSKFGETLLCTELNRVDDLNMKIELAFELIRREHHPHRPSRFQSLFAAESLTGIDVFKRKFRISEGAIRIVECETYFRGDMFLLRIGEDLDSLIENAHRYWSGLPGKVTPFWECLLIPPVRVLGSVGEDHPHERSQG